MSNLLSSISDGKIVTRAICLLGVPFCHVVPARTPCALCSGALLEASPLGLYLSCLFPVFSSIVGPVTMTPTLTG